MGCISQVLFSSVFICGIMPITFERINLLWHGGSYQCFPFRYGFIPILIIYLGALYYFEKYETNELGIKIKYKKIYMTLCFFILIMELIALKIVVPEINKNVPAFFNNILYIIVLEILPYYISIYSFKIKYKTKELLTIIIVTSNDIIQWERGVYNTLFLEKSK